MLTLVTGEGSRDCGGVDRRDFLRIGAAGLAGLSLPNWLEARAFARETGVDFIKDRAVVFLYLSGGASHIETFSPNMDAPHPYRSLTGEVSTSLPGVTFGGNFPKLAKLAHRMSIVRSFSHRVGGHEQAHVHVLTGGTDPRGDGNSGFSIGSVYSRLRGAHHAETGMPTYSLLTETEIDGQYRKEHGRVVKGSRPGELGASFAPFHKIGEGDNSNKRKKSRREGGGGSFAEDIRLHLPEERLNQRRSLLAALDGVKRQFDADGRLESLDKFRAQAYELILGEATKAFDLSREDPDLVSRYDTSAMKIGHKKFRPSTLGQQMLLARRLVEAGCGFITVHSAGWDMHADGNNPGMVDGMNMLGPTVDRAVSAFLEDIEARGLGDKILLVITGDFGRTPKVNNRGGRDHWARLGTLAFAGGGLHNGQVVGSSDRQNGEPATDPISPHHMMSTILASLFDLGELRLVQGLPRVLTELIEDLEPIPELV